jgi:hypothetical protein
MVEKLKWEEMHIYGKVISYAHLHSIERKVDSRSEK